MSGTGVSIEQPTDRAVVVNNVIKHFSGAERDRAKATQILDFIIDKKKRQEKQSHANAERKKEAEQAVLLAFLQREKDKGISHDYEDQDMA
jgi:hypothetical protein